MKNPVAKFSNEAKKAYDRAYYRRKEDECKARSLAYYHEHREEVNARQRNRRVANYERHMLATCKARAKKYGIPFDLELGDIVIPETCPLLGCVLTREQGNGKAFPNTASLDRIDPSTGYVKGNVQVISQRANRMKNDATNEELVYFAKALLGLYET